MGCKVMRKRFRFKFPFQQKYSKWREKKRRQYIDGGYKHTFWKNLLYFTLRIYLVSHFKIQILCLMITGIGSADK